MPTEASSASCATMAGGHRPLDARARLHVPLEVVGVQLDQPGREPVAARRSTAPRGTARPCSMAAIRPSRRRTSTPSPPRPAGPAGRSPAPSRLWRLAVRDAVWVPLCRLVPNRHPQISRCRARHPIKLSLFRDARPATLSPYRASEAAMTSFRRYAALLGAAARLGAGAVRGAAGSAGTPRRAARVRTRTCPACRCRSPRSPRRRAAMASTAR